MHDERPASARAQAQLTHVDPPPVPHLLGPKRKLTHVEPTAVPHPARAKRKLTPSSPPRASGLSPRLGEAAGGVGGGAMLVPAAATDDGSRVPAEALPDFLGRRWTGCTSASNVPALDQRRCSTRSREGHRRAALACALLVRVGWATPVTTTCRRCQEIARAPPSRPRSGLPAAHPLVPPRRGRTAGCGLDDDGLDELTGSLQSTYDQGYVFAMERTPSQTMDLVSALDACRVRHGFPPMDDLLARSIVGRRPPVDQLADADVYDLTHVVFAACDMGLGQRPPLPPDTLRWSTSATGALLRLYLDERDWDLVGELLLVCRCLGITPEPVFSRARRALVDAQAGDGSVPDTSYSASRASTKRGEERRLYEFGSNFHPTIVAMEAAALTQGWVPDR